MNASIMPTRHQVMLIVLIGDLLNKTLLDGETVICSQKLQWVTRLALVEKCINDIYFKTQWSLIIL